MPSLRSLPTIAVAVILYNLLALSGGIELLNRAVFTVPMLRGGDWRFTIADLVLLVAIVTFCIEIIKATQGGNAAILDHVLSLILLIIAGFEFLTVPEAATSTFFFVVVLCLIDVIAGFSIGSRAARRNTTIGGPPAH